MLIGQLVPRDDDVAWSRWVNKNCRLEFGRSDRKCSWKFSKYRLFKGWTEELYHSTATEVWLAIRFKIMTSCTWAFLPRIIIYNRYVWAFIPYTTIYIVYIRVFNTHICAKSNARLYALLKTRICAYLSKPTYTRAKMCIYAGFRNQSWYKMARKVPLTE